MRKHYGSVEREFFISTPRGYGKSWLGKYMTEAVSIPETRKEITVTVTTKDSAAPGWRLTSVRWLEESTAVYVHKTSGRPAAERLLAALASMRYGDADEELWEESGLIGTAAELRERMVSRWTEADHHLMVNFIGNGGYHGRKGELLRTALAASRKITLETDDGAELPELLVVENGDARGVMRTDGLASAEPEADEESLERAVAHSSAFAGSW